MKTSLGREGRVLFSALCAIYCGILGVGTMFGCGGGDRATAAQSQALAPAAVAEAQKVESLLAARYEQYRFSLSAADIAEEDGMADEAGASGNRLFIEWSRRGVVRQLWAWRMRIPTNADAAASDEEKAAVFFREHGALFGLSDGSQSLVFRRSRPSVTGKSTVIWFDQRLLGLPVFGAGMLVHVGREGDIEWLAGHAVPEAAVSPARPLVSAEEAADVAGGILETAVLGWWDPEIFGKPADEVRLAWKVRTADEEYDVYVDAFTSGELSRVAVNDSDEHKEIFRCNGCLANQLPGSLQFDDVCHSSGDNACPTGYGCNPNPPCQIPAWQGTAQHIYNNTNATHDYYLSRHSRDSWDNAQCGQTGHPCTNSALHRMRAISDTGVGNCNAGWISFTSSTAPAVTSYDDQRYCLDVVGHEPGCCKCNIRVCEGKGYLAGRDCFSI